MTLRINLPQVRHERIVDYQTKHNRSSYVEHIKVQATSQGAIEHLKPTSMTNDVMRTHPRKAILGKLIVQSGEYLMDIDRSLRKKLLDKATANVEDPHNLPSFAEQGLPGTFLQYDPEEEETARDLLVELAANTRVNQQVSIHPTTDATAVRIDRERDELHNESKESS